MKPSKPSEKDRSVPEIVIRISPTRRPDFFGVTLGTTILVKSSRQPRCDAARVLHRLGYPDDTLLVSRKAGSEIVSIRGSLGCWRTQRIKDGRNGPEFAKYEPFPTTRVRPKDDKTRSSLDEKAGAQLDVPS